MSDTEKFSFLGDSARIIWDSNRRELKSSTSVLLQNLNNIINALNNTNRHDMVDILDILKELETRYNAGKMDKYKLQYIYSISKLPHYIKPLINLVDKDVK